MRKLLTDKILLRTKTISISFSFKQQQKMLHLKPRKKGKKSGPNCKKNGLVYNVFIIKNKQPLIVWGPGQIFDWSRYGLKLILQNVLLVDCVPDTHLPTLVRRGNIKPAWGVLRNIHLGGMLKEANIKIYNWSSTRTIEEIKIILFIII